MGFKGGGWICPGTAWSEWDMGSLEALILLVFLTIFEQLLWCGSNHYPAREYHHCWRLPLALAWGWDPFKRVAHIKVTQGFPVEPCVVMKWWSLLRTSLACGFNVVADWCIYLCICCVCCVFVHLCVCVYVCQVIVHEVPGQELEVEVFDKDPDQDDFLGR